MLPYFNCTLSRKLGKVTCRQRRNFAIFGEGLIKRLILREKVIEIIFKVHKILTLKRYYWNETFFKWANWTIIFFLYIYFKFSSYFFVQNYFYNTVNRTIIIVTFKRFVASQKINRSNTDFNMKSYEKQLLLKQRENIYPPMLRFILEWICMNICIKK